MNFKSFSYISYYLIASSNCTDLLFGYTIFKNKLYFDNETYESIVSKNTSDINMIEFMNLVDLQITNEKNNSLESIGLQFSCRIDKFVVSYCTLYSKQ